MYSDKWLTDLSNKRTSVEELKGSLIYCYYWIDKDNNKTQFDTVGKTPALEGVWPVRLCVYDNFWGAQIYGN